MKRHLFAMDRCLMRESGAALIMCLILLGALSLLGLSAASERVMQMRMSSNSDSGLARRLNANSGLNWAEDWLLGMPGTGRPVACAANCTAADVIRPVGAYGIAPQHMNLQWWQLNGHAVGFAPEASPPPAEFAGPWYIIEEVHIEPAVNPESLQLETAYYKIMARGMATGPTQNSVTESILARPWGHESLSNGFPPNAETVPFCKSMLTQTPCGRMAWRWLKQ